VWHSATHVTHKCICRGNFAGEYCEIGSPPADSFTTFIGQ